MSRFIRRVKGSSAGVTTPACTSASSGAGGGMEPVKTVRADSAQSS